ncbi:hypothetical protein K457DRAFT_17036 [Linnemannia elongata AG-77]|uniref:Uncharacterized protein n=1 Tax=Linnemannia elongata AG-77 TaxID=1314771 RepID=A0A197K3G2_9FUNG|nr:hypothetical protein K457DRAFT_17036 [Linnemannia elongata AG-77]
MPASQSAFQGLSPECAQDRKRKRVSELLVLPLPLSAFASSSPVKVSQFWKDETDASLLAEPSFVDGRTNRHGQKFSHGRYKPTARTALNPTNHRPPNLLARPSGTHYTIIFQL